MAKELVRGTEKAIAVKVGSAIKKHAKKAAKKHAAKKSAVSKHAAKKHAKKAAKHVQANDLRQRSLRIEGPADKELLRAFHHLQRASAVLSLLEAASGSDLRALLQYGTELYRKAARGKAELAETAAELLRAAEHLAMAGLYAARAAQPSGVKQPSVDHLDKLGQSIIRRLAKIDPIAAYEARLHAMAFELVKRAEGADHDPHLAWELVNGADGICAALEEGLD